jgi:hypothetical protein
MHLRGSGTAFSVLAVGHIDHVLAVIAVKAHKMKLQS